MKDFFTYLTVSDEDKNWGLYLNVAGRSEIAPHCEYPSTEHPSGYYFAWNSGRVLQEYQLNFITSGKGILENIHGRFHVKEGSLMLIPKDSWHRYRPLKNTGWIENYIGFAGLQAEHYMDFIISNSSQPVIHCGIREDIIEIYYKIFDLAQKEEPGYQQIASGLVLQLIGNILSFKKRMTFSGKQIEVIIQKIRVNMRENVEEDLNLQELASTYNIGYSYFRKMFKQYTGVPPKQYLLDLKIMRSKELLLTTDMSIKEISNAIGFESAHYFSRYFKKKAGISPSEFKHIRPNKTNIFH